MTEPALRPRDGQILVPLPKEFEPIHVLVRTVNVHETPERYGKINVPRLAGIARRFRLDHDDQIGLIGMTEPTRKIKQCLHMPAPAGDPLSDDDCSATEGLKVALEHEFGQKATFYHNDNGGSEAKDIGVVMGADWERIGNHSRRMGIGWAQGPNWDINWTWARKLQMVHMRHRPSGLRLRFFCTHFSPGSTSTDREKRARQAHRMASKIRDDSDFIDRDDPLPPIVVGDFNARRVPGENPEESIEVLQKYFRQPLFELLPLPGGPPPTLIDSVWIGRREYFPHIRYDFETLSRHAVKLTHVENDSRGRPFTVLSDDGLPLGPLSDHKFAEGFMLRIVAVQKDK